MKIFHVIDSMDPAQGGPPMAVARLAAAQASLGHDVNILCYESPGRSDEVKASLAAIPHFKKVNIIAYPLGGYLEKITGLSSRAHLNRIVKKGDVLHLHGLWRPLLLSAAKVALWVGAKYVVAPHGMLAPWSLEQKSWKKWVALKLVWLKVLNSASFLHVLNADEVTQISRFGLRCHLEIIPNGIFPEELDKLPLKSTFYNANPQLNCRPYILFLGRLHYVKGLDYLAEAFKNFALQNLEVDLVVAGPDGGMRGQFEQKIAELGLTRRVHMVGPLYGLDKYATFVDALCFCQPSRQEGFSMSIIEAMGCGLPVVISKNCHFPQVAEAGAGMVVDLDSDAISEALLQLMEDADQRKRAGMKARELILRDYTWGKIAEKSIAAYQKAIDIL